MHLCGAAEAAPLQNLGDLKADGNVAKQIARRDAVAIIEAHG
jgi:hypothetical protein